MRSWALALHVCIKMIAKLKIQCLSYRWLSILGVLLIFSAPMFSPAANLGQVDRNFVEATLGKTVPVLPDTVELQVPNCVATVLRAGQYIPFLTAFGTDNFWEEYAPNCFDRIQDKPKSGDIGIIEYIVPKKKFRTLAHAVLFLDEDLVFEKPSPDPKDVFRYSSWKKIKDEYNTFNTEEDYFKLFVLRWKPKQNCAFVNYNNFYKALPERHIVKRVAQELDANVRIQSWPSPKTFSCQEASNFMKKSKDIMFRRLGAVGKNLTIADRMEGLFEYLATKNLFDIVYGTGMCPQ